MDAAMRVSPNQGDLPSFPKESLSDDLSIRSKVSTILRAELQSLELPFATPEDLKKHNIKVSGMRVIIETKTEGSSVKEKSIRYTSDNKLIIVEKTMTRTHHLAIKFLLNPIRWAVVAAVNYAAYSILSFTVARSIQRYVIPLLPTTWITTPFTLPLLIITIVVLPIMSLSKISFGHYTNAFMRNYAFKAIDG